MSGFDFGQMVGAHENDDHAFEEDETRWSQRPMEADIVFFFFFFFSVGPTELVQCQFESYTWRHPLVVRPLN